VSGLVVVVLFVPKPPPSWPSMTSEVGILLGAPVVAKVRLLIRVIVNGWPLGTVIKGGCQVAPSARPVVACTWHSSAVAPQL